MEGALSPGSLQQFSGNRGLSEVCGAALGKNLWMFRALKKENGNRCWNEWKDEDKSWPETGAEVPDHIKEEVYYQMFLQYVFYCQWMAVKSCQ